LFIQLELSNSRKIIVGSVYRPGTAHPSLSYADAFDNFLEILTNVLDELTSFNHSIYLTGDTNLDVLQHSNSSQISEYINLLSSYGVLQAITKPTRCADHSATIIDHIATNANLSVYESLIITSRVSDHFPIVFFVPTCKPRPSVKAIYARDFLPRILLNSRKLCTQLVGCLFGTKRTLKLHIMSFLIFSSTYMSFIFLKEKLNSTRNITT
jgi:hypothetical protein